MYNMSNSNMSDYKLELVNDMLLKLCNQVYNYESREISVGIVDDKIYKCKVVFITIDQQNMKRYFCDVFYYLDTLSCPEDIPIHFNIEIYKCLGKDESSNFKSISFDKYERHPSKMAVENIDIDELYRMFIEDEIQLEIEQEVERMENWQ